MATKRPKWTEALRWYLNDDILSDDALEYPEDGSDDDLLTEIDDAVNAILCRTYGHEVIDDQCGIPAHRYCAYCHKLESQLADELPTTT